MQAGLNVLRPRDPAELSDRQGRDRAVKGDLHDIGKNLVCMMLEGASFDIIDLGRM